MSRPPKLAERLLVWMFRRNRNTKSLDLHIQDRLAESIAGDLEEVYLNIELDEGRAKAKRWYWTQMWQALPAFVVFEVNHFNSTFIMFFKTALRHFKRTFWFTSINIVGLAIALGVSILAFLFAQSELDYDTFHDDSDQIYRVGMSVFFDELRVFETTPFPLADELEASIPHIETAFRYTAQSAKNVRSGDVTIESTIHLVDDSFLSEFNFPLALGRKENLFADPNATVISQALGAQLFGGSSPMGKTISIEIARDTWIEVTIKGVLKPMERNSNLQFDVLASELLAEQAFGASITADWMPKSPTVTFIKLRPGSKPEDIDVALNEVASRHNLTQFTEGLDVERSLPIERLTDAHFSPLFNNRILKPNGDRTQVSILAGIALLMLLIACVNFINLSTGLSAGRSKEVGVRKVFGAVKGQLARQYLFENALIVFVALMLGLGIALEAIPPFNAFSGGSLSLTSLLSLQGFVTLGLLLVIVSVCAGAYPAFVMSKFKPIDALRPTFTMRSKHAWSRLMIGFQFVVSICLIASTLSVHKQLNHMGNQDLGFNSEHVVVQHLSRGMNNDVVDRYRTMLQSNPHVLTVAGARATILGDAMDSALSVTFNDAEYVLAANKIDASFIDALGLTLAEGRNFSPGFKPSSEESEENSVIVNEAFVRQFEIENPIGSLTPFALTREGPSTIIGVVKDYHYLSLKHGIEPIILYPRTGSENRQIITRIVGTNIEQTIQDMATAWNELETGASFNYTFLDEAIAQQYISEARIRGLGSLASGLAVFIAFLGLIGLTALSVARRTREIGIRKVLGASSWKVIALFNLEYVTLILISSVVAFGLSWYVLDDWLAQFTYRIDVPIEILVASCLGLMVFAFAIISIQTFKAANSNPVDVMRYE